ncbi:MAG: pilus assembly protein PilM [Planctomycetaceae bacterium]|nr:pilus assembly protein PilM [Planctomycetaceae bacterium]
MAHWVAITWENDRLLFLSANTSGKSLTFENAAALDDPKKLGELVAKCRLAKADTIVVLNRSDVEVRPLVFPPVPDNELPDLVKFQAGREFNNYDPSAPVDFFVTSKLEDVTRSTLFPAVKPSDLQSMPDGAPKHILASTLRLATFQKIKSFCEEHHLVLKHVVLRPCTTASLWSQSGNAIEERAALLVELDKHEASQTVVLQGEPVFMRSPKISRPQDVSVPDFAARILAELKRTRIAARNEIQGIDVDEVVLCGNNAAFESLAEQLKKGLDIPVRLFDPLQGLAVKTPDADEQHTALFGAIGQVVRREPFQIDFVNPKRRPEDTSKRNWLTGIAAAVLFLIFGLFGYVYFAQTSLKKEVDQLTVKFNDLSRTSSTVVNQQRQLDEIDRWRAGNVNWFEQLAWLSQNALPAEDMMIRDLRFETPPTAGTLGNISFIALLRNQSLVTPMMNGFRDANHIPQPGLISPERGNPQRYLFRSNLTIRLESP